MKKGTLLKIIGIPVGVYVVTSLCELFFWNDMTLTSKAIIIIMTTITLYLTNFTNFVKKYEKD